METTRRRLPALLPALLVAAFLAAPPAAFAAKLARPPVPGERVRIGLTDGSGPLTGTLLASRVDALEIALEPDSTRRVIPGEIIAGLEVQRRHNHAGRGAVIGLLVGGLAGLGAAAGINHVSRSENEVPGSFILVGALGGAALGAVLGEGSHETRWDAARRP